MIWERYAGDNNVRYFMYLISTVSFLFQLLYVLWYRTAIWVIVQKERGHHQTHERGVGLQQRRDVTLQVLWAAALKSVQRQLQRRSRFPQPHLSGIQRLRRRGDESQSAQLPRNRKSKSKAMLFIYRPNSMLSKHCLDLKFCDCWQWYIIYQYHTCYWSRLKIF